MTPIRASDRGSGLPYEGTSERSLPAGEDRPPTTAVPADEAELDARFRTALQIFALRRLGDAAEADDVVQETLSRVLVALRRGQLLEPRALPGFLFETASNVCLHRLRKLGRQARAHHRLASEGGRAIEPAGLAQLLGRERCVEVRAALAELPATDRELLRCLYFADEAPSVVASRLEIAEGALRVRRHRALRRLRRILERRHQGRHTP